MLYVADPDAARPQRPPRTMHRGPPLSQSGKSHIVCYLLNTLAFIASYKYTAPACKKDVLCVRSFAELYFHWRHWWVKDFDVVTHKVEFLLQLDTLLLCMCYHWRYVTLVVVLWCLALSLS